MKWILVKMNITRVKSDRIDVPEMLFVPVLLQLSFHGYEVDVLFQPDPVKPE